MTNELTDTLNALAGQADGTVAVNPDTGAIVYADAKAHELLGYKPDTLAGEPLDALLPQRVKNDHARWLTAFMTNRSSSQSMSERTIAARRRDGSMVEANAVIHTLDGMGCVFLFTASARMAALQFQLDTQETS